MKRLGVFLLWGVYFRFEVYFLQYFKPFSWKDASNFSHDSLFDISDICKVGVVFATCKVTLKRIPTQFSLLVSCG